MKTAYKDMEDKLRNREPFNGNSVTAGQNEIGEYIVKSYDTVIYRSSGYFNNGFYSMTTSKIQNMLIDIFSLNNGKRKRL